MSELEAGPPHNTAKASLLRRLATRACRFLLSPIPSDTEAQDTERESQASGDDAWFTPAPRNDGRNEESAAKMWSIYVGEAERYDRALVERWRADREGMLIFAGLFSASLTTFLIESYNNLQPDSGELTVAAIQQLVAISLGDTVAVQTPSKFTPTTSAVVCNALWFVSLSLSLICALLATLVEQWAREFLHKTDMRPYPARRARIFSFLYFGIKSFHMHTVVDVIPSLIHGSLLLFFAGLVAFLLPVNHLIMYLMAGALIILLFSYSVLTVLPVLYLNCPYRTPLSTPLWSLSQRDLAFFRKPNGPKSVVSTMTEAVVHCAIQNTEERDQRAIQWTLDSLTDDTELLPFVEILPDIVSGPGNGIRIVDKRHILLPILGDILTPSPLVQRVVNLTRKNYGNNPLSTRRTVAGYKALSSLCMMPRAWEYRFEIPWFWWQEIGGTWHGVVSLAVEYHKSRWCQHLVSTIRDLLRFDHSSADLRNRVEPRIRTLLTLLGEQQAWFFTLKAASDIPHPHVDRDPLQDLHNVAVELGQSMPTAFHWDKLQQAVDSLHQSYDWTHNCAQPLVFFLRDAFFAIHRGVSVFELRFAEAIIQEMRNCLPRMPMAGPPLILDPEIKLDKGISEWTNPHQLDLLGQIAFSLFGFLSPQHRRNSDAYLRYLLERGSSRAVNYALTYCDVGALAVSLGDHLEDKAELQVFEPQRLRIVHAIAVVTGCLLIPERALVFIDHVVDRVSSETLSRYPIIRAVHRLRRVEQLDSDLQDELRTRYAGVVLVPTPDKISRLQLICQDELFGPQVSPLSLAANADDVKAFVHGLRKQLISRYIDFLAEFITLPTPMAIKRTIVWAHVLRLDVPWSEVDPELQHRVFEAILAQCRSMLLPSHRYEAPEVDFCTQLWSASIFTTQWSTRLHPIYNLSGIELPCLRMLSDALDIYHEAADSQGETTEPDGYKKLDTRDSEQLRAAVRKEIAREESRLKEVTLSG